MENRLLKYLKDNPERVFTAADIKAALGISDEELKRETVEVIGTHGLKVVGEGDSKKYGYIDVYKYGYERDTETNCNKHGHFVLKEELPELR